MKYSNRLVFNKFLKENLLFLASKNVFMLFFDELCYTKTTPPCGYPFTFSQFLFL